MTMIDESRFIQAEDGTRLHVKLHRSKDPRGPTCLLLHGFGDGGYVWEDTTAALADICSTAVLDLRGHGDSGPSPSGIYDLDMNLKDVSTVVSRLALTRLILVGHSFGGEIVLRLAAQPSTVAAIFVDIAPTVDIETAHQATVYMRETMRTYKSIEQYSSLLKEMRLLLSEAVARQLATGSLRVCEGGFELKLDPALIKYADDEFTSAPQWRELLPQIRCPTLVVRGAGSAMVSASAAKEMVRLLPRAQLVTIPRSGHAVMSDNPSAFCASLAGFIRALLSIPKP
jgi:pimeloyl-ACP methyl ester carboxylesterase